MNMLFSYASEIMGFIDDQKDTPQNWLEDILWPLSSSGHLSRPEVLLATSVGTDRVQPKPKPSLKEETGTMLTGRVEVDGLRYCRQLNIKSDAIGQYPIGTKISITGFTEEGTTVVKGDMWVGHS